MSHQFISYHQRKFGCLTSLLRIFGSDWNPTEKKSHSKEVSQQRSLTAKRSHSKEVSQQRNFTAKKSHSKEISMFFERSLARKLRFHKLCFNIFNAHFLWRLARKLRFHIFNIYFLRDVSHESSASFSHLELSLFEGRLARKLRFTSSIFSFWRKSRTKALIATRLRQSVFADFYRFWRPCIFRFNLLYKRHQNLTFFSFGVEITDVVLAVGPRLPGSVCQSLALPHFSSTTCMTTSSEMELQPQHRLPLPTIRTPVRRCGPPRSIHAWPSIFHFDANASTDKRPCIREAHCRLPGAARKLKEIDVPLTHRFVCLIISRNIDKWPAILNRLDDTVVAVEHWLRARCTQRPSHLASEMFCCVQRCGLCRNPTSHLTGCCLHRKKKCCNVSQVGKELRWEIRKLKEHKREYNSSRGWVERK